jgi:hypothetical protein
MSKKIKLSNGKYSIVDNDNYKYLNQWSWHQDTDGYVVRYTKLPTGEIMKIRMDLVVMIRAGKINNAFLKNGIPCISMQES